MTRLNLILGWKVGLLDIAERDNSLFTADVIGTYKTRGIGGSKGSKSGKTSIPELAEEACNHGRNVRR